MPSPKNGSSPKTPPGEQTPQQLESASQLSQDEAGPAGGSVFDPESLELMCRHDLPGALRLLADHLDRQEISGSLWSFQGNGMVQDWRREHFLMTLDLAVLPSRAGK